MNNENFNNTQYGYQSQVYAQTNTIARNSELINKKAIKTMLIAQLISLGIVAAFSGIVNVVSMVLISNLEDSDMVSRLSTVISTCIASLSSVIPSLVVLYAGYNCYKEIKGTLKFFFAYKLGDTVAGVLCNLFLFLSSFILMKFETSSSIFLGTVVSISSILTIILSVVFSLIILKKLNAKTTANIADSFCNNDTDVRNNNFALTAVMLVVSHVVCEIVSSVVIFAKNQIVVNSSDLSFVQDSMTNSSQFYNLALNTITGTINRTFTFVLFLVLGYLCYKTFYGTVKFYTCANLGSLFASVLGGFVSTDVLMLLFNFSVSTSATIVTVSNVVILIISCVLSVLILNCIEKKEKVSEIPLPNYHNSEIQ